MFQANTELPYPHFFHLFSPDLIQTVQVMGDVLISYIGFGNKGMASFRNKICYCSGLKKDTFKKEHYSKI